MLQSVKGIFKNGVAQPDESVQGREGYPVVIIFLEKDQATRKENTDWGALVQLVKECAVATGIADLAHQHDHYLYGKAKGE